MKTGTAQGTSSSIRYTPRKRSDRFNIKASPSPIVKWKKTLANVQTPVNLNTFQKFGSSSSVL